MQDAQDTVRQSRAKVYRVCPVKFGLSYFRPHHQPDALEGVYPSPTREGESPSTSAPASASGPETKHGAVLGLLRALTHCGECSICGGQRVPRTWIEVRPLEPCGVVPKLTFRTKLLPLAADQLRQAGEPSPT